MSNNPYFTRRESVPEVEGNYRKYRPYVREDFKKVCAYCLIIELFANGAESFELDHFLPQKYYPALINDFYNLYYSCRLCNLYKSCLPKPSDRSEDTQFVDLCKDDFTMHFKELPDGRWEALTPKAKYTLIQLRLNRKTLVKVRRIMANKNFRSILEEE